MADPDISIFNFDDSNIDPSIQEDGNEGSSMNVLLNAIDSNAPPVTSSTLPSLGFFDEARTDASTSQTGSSSSVAPGLSISSLLAASQQLAAPEQGSTEASTSSWLPISAALDPFHSGSLNFEDDYLSMSKSIERIMKQSEGQKLAEMQDIHVNEVQRSKRSWDEANPEVRRDQVRRAMNLNSLAAVPLPAGLNTILCLHGAFAQKSYGTEKRFLSPPPMIRIEGPLALSAQAPHLSLSLISEDGSKITEETASLESVESKAYFRNLHVGSSGGAKSFSLQLSLRQRLPAPPSSITDSLLSLTTSSHEHLPTPFANFESSSVSIVSKPSKKTAKARNMSTCIRAGSTISLFNRINSQTVRTKYMTIDDGRLSGRTGQWSAFAIHVVRRADAPPTTGTGKKGSTKQPKEIRPDLVTYGSEVLLTDLLTGVSSESLVIHRVEKNRVMLDAVGPVSQLQKVAFGRKTPGNQPIYLSISPDGLDMNGQPLKQEVVGETPAKKSKKDFTAEAHESAQDKTFLSFQPPKVAYTGEDGTTIVQHEIDDYVAWTVTGVASFSYSFFNAYNSMVDPSAPTIPITPFPTVSSPPQYDRDAHTLTTTINNFFHQDTATGSASALEIWLGAIGPLKVEIVTGEEAQDFSPTSLSISLPSFEQMVASSQETEMRKDIISENGTNSPITLPLIIVRPVDGTAYMTHRTLWIERGLGAVHSAADMDTLLESDGKDGEWKRERSLVHDWHIRIL